MSVFFLPFSFLLNDGSTALWALVSTMEALIMSGVTDAYELYKYIHPSEVGTALGSGMGGVQAMSAMFKERREERDVQKDILQETCVASGNECDLLNYQVYQYCRWMDQSPPSFFEWSREDSRRSLVWFLRTASRNCLTVV